jgi:hypothetical protein
MLEESSTDPSLARKATLLIGEILQIANKVLPLSVASKIQVNSDDATRIPSCVNMFY